MTATAQMGKVPGVVRHVLLLGATFSTGNLGVGALASGALEVARAAYPEADIRFLDYGREPREENAQVDGKALQVPLINLRFSWKILLPNNIALLLILAVLQRVIGKSGRARLLRANRWLDQITTADLALAVSGGDSFSDIYGRERFFYVALPQLLVVLLGKPLVLLPQTIGPFKGRVSKGVAGFLVRKALRVYSRDAEGVAEIKRLLGEMADGDAARFCYDMGFVIGACRPSSVVFNGLDLDAHGARLLVGVNVSGLLLIGGYDRKNMFGLGIDYRRVIQEVIRVLIVERGATVLLVPHVFGDHMESDERAVASVYAQLHGTYGDRLACVRGEYNQHEIKYIVGACDFFVGSRMHACIAALSQGIPAFGIAYSDKFRGVFESVGAGNLVADPRYLDEPLLLDLLRLRLSERHDIQSRLKEEMPRVRQTVLGVLQGVGM